MLTTPDATDDDPADAESAGRASGSPADAARARLELFSTAAAAWAALDAGVFRALMADGERTSPELADELAVDAGVLERVLGVLAGTGLVARADEGAAFGPGPLLETLGPADDPFARMELAVWRHAPEALRSGAPLPLSGSPTDRERVYADIADDLARMSEPAARRLAEELDSPGDRILDVGCGAGVWSLALARAHADVRVVGLDLPAVVERFTERARRLGLEDRVEARPGDMHEVELEPRGYDLVIAAHLLRLEPRERARSLLARLADAVAPGGGLLVVDALPSDAPRARRLHRAYRLHLALRNGEGDTLDPAALEAWLRAEGLGSLRRIDLGTAGLPGVVLARRS